MKVDESSGYSFRGSITPDLMISKIWLALQLKKLAVNFSTIYILGSWYGNMAYVLIKLNVPSDKIINVDINRSWLNFSSKLLKPFNQNIQSMDKDANKITYQQLGKNGLVINTSETDIPGTDWYENIPQGTLVAIQSRDNADNQRYSTIDEFDLAYPMSETLYIDKLDLTDPETDYQRFMKIGIK